MMEWRDACLYGLVGRNTEFQKAYAVTYLIDFGKNDVVNSVFALFCCSAFFMGGAHTSVAESCGLVESWYQSTYFPQI